MILQVEFQLDPALLEVEFSDGDLTLDVAFDGGEDFPVDFGEVQTIVSEDVPVYDGAYGVTPSLEEQTLETAGLMMEENITIEEIPIYVVSNNSGGNTVIIGG